MPQNQTAKSNQLFALSITLIFAATSIWLVQYHEMWRDELQAWLLARDSPSIIELFTNLKYEAHPGLWHILLYPLSRLFKSPESMQFLHVLIATLSVYVLVAYSPFTKLQKSLIPFGYFFFYEYSQISRNYAPGVLLAFIICALYPHRYKRHISIAICIFLLCHTSVFGLFVAISLSIALFVDILFNDTSSMETKSKQKIGFSFAIMSLGIISSLIHLTPPNDHNFHTEWYFHFDIKRIGFVIRSIISAFLPIPTLQLNFWNSKLIYHASAYDILFTLGFILIFLLLSLRSLMCRPAALYFFLSAFLGPCTFFYVKYPGFMRHYGYLFLSYIIAMWIARHSNARPYHSLPERLELKTILFVRRTFTVFLIIHLFSGFQAIFLDYKNPFSGAQQAAQHIVSEKLDGLLMIARAEHAASVIGYLPDKEIYYLRSRRFGTFTVWDNKRIYPTDELSLYEATKRITSAGQSGLFILDYPLLNPKTSGFTINKILTTSKSIRQDEQFFIYRFTLKSN